MTIFSYFSRKCFGARGERLVRTLVLCAVVYGGLSAAGWRVGISPFVFGFMVSTFSGGVMGRALIAADNQCELRHLMMLPGSARSLVGGYVSAMAFYTLASKTLPLLAILCAVSAWTVGTLVFAFFCALNGVLFAALFISRQGGRREIAAGLLTLLVVFRLAIGSPVLVPLLVFSAIAEIFLLARCDAYTFLRWAANGNRRSASARRFLMLRYFLRHLLAHRNYLVNTIGLWLLAAALPFFFAGFAGMASAVPLGFAILTLNTPLGILLSADPLLARAVRLLPGAFRHFCLPYAALLAGANLIADVIFLASWVLTTGSVTLPMLAAALFIALQSALASVWLEWQHPLKNWRIESDLWHHPRKYLVPGTMLLLSAAIGIWPSLLTICWGILAVECVMVWWWVRRKNI